MRYSGIIRSSLSDGLGWRIVLFVSGCSHGCQGCHNKDSWDPESGKEFDITAMEILLSELSKATNSGLTFSGGDPLMPYNQEDTLTIARLVKTMFPDKTIWLYTGYDWEDVRELEIMKYIDVLVDGKFIIDERDVTIAFRGSRNQRIIDVQKSLADGNTVVLDMD